MSLQAFSTLLERLLFSQGRLAKIALMRDWFATQPDPDRGIGLAALMGELTFTAAKPAMIRALAAERTDPVLWDLSYDFVGDMAETVALIWPAPAAPPGPALGLAEIVEALELAPRAAIPAMIAGWLDQLDASGRLALVKLVTGGLRVGASGRLARIALAEWAGQPVEAVEEAWHASLPPYLALFRWLEGQGPRPDAADAPVFRPVMLAHPLEAPDLAGVSAATHRAEWKWDGIRIQACAGPGGRRLWSRTGEDFSATFPEVVAAMDFSGVVDGELLVVRDGVVAPFGDLQQRLNRKVVTARMQRDFPVTVRLYDLLFDGAEDLRPLPFDARRARLEAFVARETPARFDVSPLVPFADVAALAEKRAGARGAAIEGLMIKRADAPYVPGRVKGLWWKWKRAALTVDCVLMYAQRGHGKRSSFYSDYTFGMWRGEELVPVGKAYSGFTDQELVFLDRWVREHTTGRFGPVREVEKGLVLEVAFDAAQASTRHRSGLAMRFPRIARIRADKPAAEADRLEVLAALVPGAVA